MNESLCSFTQPSGVLVALVCAGLDGRNENPDGVEKQAGLKIEPLKTCWARMVVSPASANVHCQNQT